MSTISTAMNPRMLRNTLLIKWIVGLLVPLAIFTFVWNGDKIVNNVLLGFINPATSDYDIPTLIQAAIFSLFFYGTIIALVGYLVAADTGRRGMIELWIDILIFTIVPMYLVITFNNLIIGLALCAVVWPVYFFIRGRVRKARHYVPPAPLENLTVIGSEKRSALMSRARAGGFWFATLFALVSLVADLIFFSVGAYPPILLVWTAIRTLLLPVAGYFLGQLGGLIALRRTIAPEGSNGNGAHEVKAVGGRRFRVSRQRQLSTLSTARAAEEAKNLVPNDLPLRSTGAQRFYLILLAAFIVFYPVLDPFLFGFGTGGRLANYGDAGRYVILALGLNIVVGFAGLLDLGYVAFFVIGAYAWGMIGSQQFNVLTNIVVNPSLWPWLFWPMLIVGALLAALTGVLLGIPTLRLRGDYLAIVTLGFGEIVPAVFLNLNQYTNGTNGLVGIYSPKLPGVPWSSSTPLPYYYLILALIVLVVFANVRLRDSRLGRAWVAIREDEIAASSSGVNLVRTKLFAFGAGAFFSGVAGVYYAGKLGTVSPENFSFSDSVIYLAMVVIGGLGSIPGVIVGAIVVYAINVLILSQLDVLGADPTSVFFPIYQQILHIFPNFNFNNIRQLIFGVILISVMIFRPEGLIPSARRRRELHHGNDEEVQVGALDVAPGAPGFEAEVHVD
ncbi:MAG: branched-chain amino acid ABC transporter permease [Chloroflexota bacterium]|nr:branched-chain amino acid ABC transporter permease [Chloroflexota bacterium]